MPQDDPLDVGQPIAKPRSTFKRGLLVIANLFLFLLVILSGILGFILILLAMPLWLVMPMSVMRFYCGIAGMIWSLCQYIFEQVNGACLIMTGFDRIPEGESALLISNHCSFTDFFLIHALASRKGMQPYCKYFVKVSSSHALISLELGQVHSLFWVGHVSGGLHHVEAQLAEGSEEVCPGL